jgi:hypothetical protein
MDSPTQNSVWITSQDSGLIVMWAMSLEETRVRQRFLASHLVNEYEGIQKTLVASGPASPHNAVGHKVDQEDTKAQVDLEFGSQPSRIDYLHQIVLKKSPSISRFPACLA